ncbi:hypothetical protein FA15DRAFT_706782 [Coprinopsis marcescibilis]|uniref:SnoaL-like domain-containing protein n=1 Tax=Coprinopsis marcescibilis TaxID=230819 RepID=A0A5C3KQ68_COPMA|nr:hypothetical protein FA15DRAFT_706782 [Coprinopsis marcescibilis]
MRFELRPSQPVSNVSEAEYQASMRWIIAIYDAGDARNLDKLWQFFEDDSITYFGDLPPVKGKAAQVQMMRQLHNATERFEHVIRSVHILHNEIIVDHEVTYVFPDKTQEIVECKVTFFKSVGRKPLEVEHLAISLKSSPNLQPWAGPLFSSGDRLIGQNILYEFPPVISVL